MLRKAFDRTFLIFLGLAVAAGAACYHLRGGEAVTEALRTAAELFVFVLPQLAAGLLIGGLLQTMISRERMEKSFGRASGTRGLAMAGIAGAITPTGPFAAFPLVYALWAAGADIGMLTAYLAGWALIGVHRVLVWEVPFLGLEFSLFRFLVCLPMPLLAGYLAWFIADRTSLDRRPGERAG